MDASRVAAIAARHRSLQIDPHAHNGIDDEQAAERLRQQVDTCWQQLGDECSAFCDAYNRGFGSERIYCQRHADTIVVRSSDDPQETVTFARTSQRSTHGGHIEAHRYSSHSAPVELSIEGHVENHRFTLRSHGRPITAADAALVLLERFTEDLLTGVPAVE